MKLYLIPTPIGNLEDMTLRSIRVLKEVDVIFAEDTRTSGQLLKHLDISKPLFAHHAHNEHVGVAGVIKLLKEGKLVGLISDAGTPGISDPGARLVMQVRAAGFRVIPIPGASALSAALSIAGSIMVESNGQFQFLGFLPTQNKELQQTIEQMIQNPLPTVFYESPHRLTKTLLKLRALVGDERGVFIGRELSKKFESIHLLKPNEIELWLENPNNLKGEFVVMLSGAQQKNVDSGLAGPNQLARLLGQHMSSKDIAATLSAMYGLSKNDAYQMALSLKDKD
jgi:16S rRNA (cytidine1402-2'-O)-methyltransferase